MNQQQINRLNELNKMIKEIAEEMGLTVKEVEFEIVPARNMIEAISYHFPTNFSHWSFGKEYEKKKTIYEHSMGGFPMSWYGILIRQNHF